MQSVGHSVLLRGTTSHIHSLCASQPLWPQKAGLLNVHTLCLCQSVSWNGRCHQFGSIAIAVGLVRLRRCRRDIGMRFIWRQRAGSCSVIVQRPPPLLMVAAMVMANGVDGGQWRGRQSIDNRVVVQIAVVTILLLFGRNRIEIRCNEIRITSIHRWWIRSIRRQCARGMRLQRLRAHGMGFLLRVIWSGECRFGVPFGVISRFRIPLPHSSQAECQRGHILRYSDIV